MANYIDRFKNYVMSFSLPRRRERELSAYRQRVHQLRNMDKDELNYEYVNLKAKYEHKKSALTLFIISIALAVLMNVWKKFFAFMEMVLQYENSSVEITEVSFIISVITAIFITSIILFFLLTFMKELYVMKKEMMIIEEVKNESAENNETREND